MLSDEILHTIFAYSGDLRILKIKMNKTNIKYLFDNDRDIYHYLYAKTETLTSYLGEIYLKTLTVLRDKYLTMDMVFDEMMEYIKLYYSNPDSISQDYYNKIIDMIMEDYNTYYLDDKFYYNGYWEDECWHTDTESEN